MSFSICIPNYNYEQYLGITLDSILQQSGEEFEILIADNQSTDGSVALIQKYQTKHDNIQLKINSSNLGFAGNLDAVARMSTQNYIIMLSSDDVMKPNALATYSKLLGAIDEKIKPIITSAIDTIDHNGEWLKTTLAAEAYRSIWKASDRDEYLSELIGESVLKVAADDLLSRIIKASSNPFNFLATCYRRADYLRVGGYGSSRLMNPDKWFHWRLLGAVDYVYFIDAPLFQYRWHEKNQTAQEKNAGHLKFITDEYRTSMEVSDALLHKAGLSKTVPQEQFINNIIFRHGLGQLSEGLWLKAFRIFHFGWATYPSLMLRRGWKSFSYFLLLLMGPFGVFLIKVVRRKISAKQD